MSRSPSLDCLWRLSRAIADGDEISTVLQLALEAAVRLCRSDSGMVMRTDQDRRLQPEAVLGLSSEQVPAMTSMVADIVRDGAAAQARNGRSRGWPEVFVAKVAGVGQVMAVPMQSGDEPLGWVCVTGSKGFSVPQKRALAGLAELAGVAIRDAALHREIADLRAMLQAIMSHSAEGIALLDRDGRLLEMNSVWERMVGQPVQACIGRSVLEVLAFPDDRGHWPVSVLTGEWQKLGSTQAVEVELRSGNGGGRLLAQLVPIPSSGSSRVLMILREPDSGQEAEQLKSTLISAVSHELKTPVALIRGYAETLAREDAQWQAEVVRESAAVIAEEARRLERQINNLLQVSRIEAGGLPMALGPVSVPSLALRVAKAAQVGQGKHRIEVDFPNNFPVCWADEDMTREVLENLVSNAQKYSPEGTRITISGSNSGGTCTIYVTDQGPGIPEPYREAIFGRFYRLKGSERIAPGAGLGLYLAKSMVEAQGGRIWVEAAPGGGSRFAFTLPVSEGDYGL